MPPLLNAQNIAKVFGAPAASLSVGRRKRMAIDVFRAVVAVILAVAAIVVAAVTYRWPLIGDAQIFHYIHLLTEHGFVPYRDIQDINMPGCYVLEGWAMAVFGASDLGWRIYEFTLFGVLIAAMIVIARPYDWVAGLFGSMIFILQHSVYGPWNSLERDEVIAILIVAAYAFLFESMRRQQPWLSLGFGSSLGFASTMKPGVAPLFLVLLAMALVFLKKKGVPILSYGLWSIAGPVIAGGYIFDYLLSQHVLGDFFYVVRTYTALYSSMGRAPAREMLHNALPSGVCAILGFAIVAAFLKRTWRNWELWAIGVGIAFAALSYFAQGKGFRYHTYPLIATCLLWASIQLAVAMHDVKPWTRAVGITGLAIGTLVGVPIYLHRLPTRIPQNDILVSLESDLNRLGGHALDRQVECLDMVNGCFSALYHLQLVESSGSLGDLFLFTPRKAAAIDEYRHRFLNEISIHPPAVIVLSNEWFQHASTFRKIDEWPQFDAYLAANYRLLWTRTFPMNAAYRIYVWKGFSPPDSARSSKWNQGELMQLAFADNR